jgi:hypothetical protein
MGVVQGDSRWPLRQMRSQRYPYGVDGDEDRLARRDSSADERRRARQVVALIGIEEGFIEPHSATTAGLRGICETVWADRRPEELVECRQSELLLNEAFINSVGCWLLCPYDCSALERVVIDDAYVTHPFIDRAGQSQASRRTRAARSPHSSMSPFQATRRCCRRRVQRRDLGSVRRLATQHAITAGLEGPRHRPGACR